MCYATLSCSSPEASSLDFAWFCALCSTRLLNLKVGEKKKNLEKFPCKYTGRLSHVLWLPDNGLGACSRVKGHSLKSNRFFPTASSRVLVSWLQGGGPRSWGRGAGGCRCCPPSSPSGASKDQATQNLCVRASAEEIEHLVPILCQPLRAGNRERTCLIMCFTLK